MLHKELVHLADSVAVVRRIASELGAIKEAVVTAFVAVERTLVAGIRHGFGE